MQPFSASGDANHKYAVNKFWPLASWQGAFFIMLIKMKQMRGSDEQYSPSLSLAFSFVYEICFLRSFCLGF